MAAPRRLDATWDGIIGEAGVVGTSDNIEPDSGPDDPRLAGGIGE